MKGSYKLAKNILQDTQALQFLQENKFLPNDKDMLYRQFLDNFFNSYSVKHTVKEILPIITAYPKSVYYTNEEGLSVYFPFYYDKDLSILVNFGVDTNNKQWQYQANIEQLLTKVLQNDAEGIGKLISKISNLSIISNQAMSTNLYKDSLYQVLLRPFKHYDFDTNSFVSIVSAIKDKGFDVNYSTNNYTYYRSFAFDCNYSSGCSYHTNLPLYLKYFTIPTNTVATEFFEAPYQELNKNPYSYILEKIITQNNISNLIVMVKYGYINTNTNSLFLQYLSEKNQSLFSVMKEQSSLQSEESKELIAKRKAQEKFFQDAQNGNLKAFLAYSKTNDINVRSLKGTTVLWPILDSIDYYTIFKDPLTIL
ncbi:MAG: hypothetical protein ACRCTQ_07050 [Brevinemataceae bacterium]